jgi:hypothetical protein
VLLTLVLLLVDAGPVDLDRSIVTPEVLAMGVEAFWGRQAGEGVSEGRVGRGLGMESGGSVRLCQSVALGDSFFPALEPVPVPEREVVVAVVWEIGIGEGLYRPCSVSVDSESRRTRDELAGVYVVVAAATLLILPLPFIVPLPTGFDGLSLASLNPPPVPPERSIPKAESQPERRRRASSRFVSQSRCSQGSHEDERTSLWSFDVDPDPDSPESVLPSPLECFGAFGSGDSELLLLFNLKPSSSRDMLLACSLSLSARSRSRSAVIDASLTTLPTPNNKPITHLTSSSLTLSPSRNSDPTNLNISAGSSVFSLPLLAGGALISHLICSSSALFIFCFRRRLRRSQAYTAP